MKKLHLILIAMILSVSMSAFAQSDKFNYQAAVRNASGAIMQNEAVAISFSIRYGSASGTQVFAETHNLTTNDQGLVNLTIGSGTVTSGNFAIIDWSAGRYFLNVEIDGTDVGTSEFESVPFANHSFSAEKGINQFDVDSILDISSGGEENSFKTKENGKLQILVNGFNPTVTFDDDGIRGVGIGTEDPTEKLEVNGAVKITEETATPSPNTFYGNSGPLAYGQVGATNISSGYGISSVTNPNTGEYIVTLTNDFVGNPTVLITCFNSSLDTEIATYSYLGTNQINVRIVDENNAPTSSIFSLLVFGFSQ